MKKRNLKKGGHLLYLQSETTTADVDVNFKRKKKEKHPKEIIELVTYVTSRRCHYSLL